MDLFSIVNLMTVSLSCFLPKFSFPLVIVLISFAIKNNNPLIFSANDLSNLSFVLDYLHIKKCYDMRPANSFSSLL